MKAYWDSLTKEQQGELAGKVGSTPGYLRLVFNGYKKASFVLAKKLEQCTSGAITKSDLRPDTVIESWSGMVFLKFNGAKFSATDYPVLAKVFPSLVLPEARGDFIRIWDDGRGADSGRALLSWQAATSLSQFGGNYPEGSGHAIADYDGISAHQPGFSRFQYTSNSVGDGVNFVAVRPRNIAFNFLVRAK